MSFDPAALSRLAGTRRRTDRPVTLAFLVRVAVAAAVAAALCNVVLLLVARNAGWVTDVDGQPIEPLPVVIVCVVVGLLGAVAAYTAARVTKRPALWVGLAGLALWLASIQGLPPAVVGLHTVTAVWVVGWLTLAVRGGTHLR